LTAEDGYQAERSYSIASASDGTRVALTVQRLDDGEVSPYLTDELRPGDKIELRGPIGGYFVWEPSEGGPLMLVAGGSGIVPLMAVIRTRAAADDDTETRLLYSSRSQDHVIYRDELERLSGKGLTVVHALTDSQPPGWTSYARRVDAEMLAEVTPAPAKRPRLYACGPTPFSSTSNSTPARSATWPAGPRPTRPCSPQRQQCAARSQSRAAQLRAPRSVPVVLPRGSATKHCVERSPSSHAPWCGSYHPRP
jgi:ferredoxin-NADP reductase